MKQFFLSDRKYGADSDRFERFPRGGSRLGIVGRRSCRTLNELNQLVGRHSMIHLLCVQILAFLLILKGKWRKAQLLHDLNETRIERRGFVYQCSLIGAKCLVWPTGQLKIRAEERTAEKARPTISDPSINLFI